MRLADKYEACPACGRKLGQNEYDLQHHYCGWGTEAFRELQEAHRVLKSAVAWLKNDATERKVTPGWRLMADGLLAKHKAIGGLNTFYDEAKS